MNYLDWLVIFIYVTTIILIGLSLNRSQATIRDYFLGGQKVRWWQSGLSTMATQLGAISFISAPAFVALKDNGGFKWLSYELGVPLGLLLVMIVLVPVYHRAGVISIYEYLEMRFDAGTRLLVSSLFQLGRGLATAVSILMGGLIISTVFGIPTVTAILAIGAVTLIYDLLGGIRVVIYSDVIQMLIIFSGILICGVMALQNVGWSEAWNAMDPERLRVLDFNHWGLTAAGEYGFLPMLLGGIFLYAAYYGCDQSQVQRELTVRGLDNVRKSLLVNAFGRFPMVLIYCLAGILIGAVVMQADFPGQAAGVMGTSEETVSRWLENDPDRMVPLFILTYLPHGLIGFLLIAIMSALMSTLDSALNSLSAVSVRDFYLRYWKTEGDKRARLNVSRMFTVFWAVFCLGFAVIFAAAQDSTRQTAIVLINAVGSLLYGPILAAFILGIMTRWAGPREVKAGVIAGLGVNLALWQFTSISWLWWNVTGFLTAIGVAGILSPWNRAERKKVRLGSVEKTSMNWPLIYGIVIFYFFLILGIAGYIGTLL